MTGQTTASTGRAQSGMSIQGKLVRIWVKHVWRLHALERVQAGAIVTARHQAETGRETTFGVQHPCQTSQRLGLGSVGPWDVCFIMIFHSLMSLSRRDSKKAILCDCVWFNDSTSHRQSAFLPDLKLISKLSDWQHWPATLTRQTNVCNRTQAQEGGAASHGHQTECVPGCLGGQSDGVYQPGATTCFRCQSVLTKEFIQVMLHDSSQNSIQCVRKTLTNG